MSKKYESSTLGTVTELVIVAAIVIVVLYVIAS